MTTINETMDHRDDTDGGVAERMKCIRIQNDFVRSLKAVKEVASVYADAHMVDRGAGKVGGVVALWGLTTPRRLEFNLPVNPIVRKGDYDDAMVAATRLNDEITKCAALTETARLGSINPQTNEMTLDDNT
jgi:precorrin isomerase